MFGQGSPNLHRYSCRCWQPKQPNDRRYRYAHLLLALLFFASQTLHAAPQQNTPLTPMNQSGEAEAPIAGTPSTLQIADRPDEVTAPNDLQLRFAWGGGIPQQWQGKLTIENGTFTDSRVLAITSDAPSTVVKRGSELVINHRIATSYGGVDASIALQGEASIRLQLESPSGETFEQSWTMDQLVAGVNTSIDQQQNRISVSRTPVDQIRVDVNRPHLVFEPGETWRFSTKLQRSQLTNQKVGVNLSWKLDNIQLPVSHSATNLTTNENGTSKFETIEIAVPTEEGAHDLWIEYQPQVAKPTFGQFRRPKNIARRVQIVVVSQTAPTSDSDSDWQAIETLSAQRLRGSFRTSWPVPRMPGSKEPVRKGELAIVEIPESNPAVELATGASLTVPVPQSKTSRPIRVSLRYRSIAGTTLGINYLSSTQQVLHGMDSGVSVPKSVDEEQWLTHTFHVWPEETAGHIYISNDDLAVKAQIGELTFEAGPQRLPGNALPADATFDSPRRERMAFLESPDISGLFQAARQIDPQTGQALDDWNTFHSSIDRLTQHLKANFYDGAFVTVAADGSAIFPSFGIAPGPRFDSGLFSSEACDPIQKDVVELMLRMFDREGLKLVPVLTLNSTLQPLEALRETGPMTFDLIDFEGRNVDFDRSQLPIYNPLDRTLQGVCSQSTARFADRYASHNSFGGLALTCRPDCCTLLPGPRHGFDDTTLQRFIQNENIDSASFDVNALLNNDAENPQRDAWQTWRSQQMVQWYNDIAASVRKRQDHRLYLLPVDIDRNKEVASAMSPSLHRSGDFETVMKSLGLNLDATAHENGVVILSPKRIAPGLSLAQNRIGINIGQSHTAQQFFARQAGGSLFTHRGSWQRLDSGVAGSQSEDAAREKLYTIAGNANRRRYIEAIRKLDSRLIIDGGYSLPIGGDSDIAPILRIMRQLPAQPFEDIGESGVGPVCMRQLSVDGQHFFYAVNDSPWPVEVTALLGQKQLPQVLKASATSNGKAAPLMNFAGTEVLIEKSEGRNAIRIFLEPWSMFAGTATTNSAFNPYAIESFQVSLPEQIDSQLRKRLYQLKSKLAQAKVAKPMSQLLNGSFESFTDPNQSGWEFGNHDQANFDLDSAEFHEGKTSLSMQTEGNPVWIRSNTLQLPQTGRLSVSAWLRTTDATAQPKPRIAVEGVSDGENIYRFGTISSANEEARTLGTDWRRFVVHFDDLPNDLTNVRIGFDLMEAGQVSIDQVEVFDRWFDENDAVAMTQLLAGAGSQLQSEASLDGGRRVLESYWVQFLDQYAGQEEQEEVAEAKPKGRPLEIPFPTFEMPSFELPNLSPKVPKRIPLFQRLRTK